MQVLSLTETQSAEWNDLVRQEPCFSLLQSWEWGLFKEKLGWKAFRIGVEEGGRLVAGAQLLIKPLPLAVSIAYVPRGPIGRWLDCRAAELLLAELSRQAHRQGASFLKIEPPVANNPRIGTLLEQGHFQRSPVNNQPQATIIIDLSQPEENILLQMRKKTRQYIHRANREGISVRFGTSADLPAFYELMRLTGKREHFAPRSPKYYQSEWETFVAGGHGAMLMGYDHDRLIAVRTIYYFGSHAAEFHAGSITVPGYHPNYMLVWEAMKWAKAHGCLTYDMWGIPDEICEGSGDSQASEGHRENGLWGVYQFKRGFGRNIVTYIGAYDQVFYPRLYTLFHSRLFMGKGWERIATMMDAWSFGRSSNFGM